MTLVRLPLNTEKCRNFCDEFYRSSALTFEGLELVTDKDKKKFEKICRDFGFDKEELIAYELTGKQMNEVYLLKGDVAYTDDYKFIILTDYRNVGLKFALKGEYFDSIVQTNIWDMLEEEVNAE